MQFADASTDGLKSEEKIGSVRAASGYAPISRAIGPRRGRMPRPLTRLGLLRAGAAGAAAVRLPRVERALRLQRDGPARERAPDAHVHPPRLQG
eukprot:8079943-Pyramimonas_sp.AAC.3